MMDDAVAPYHEDTVDYLQLSEALFQDRLRMIRLARNEVACATGTWYALARMKHDFDFLRTEILQHSLMEGVEVKRVDGPFETD